MNSPADEQGLRDEIARLEDQLDSVRAELKKQQQQQQSSGPARDNVNTSRVLQSGPTHASALTTTPHTLLLLSDSALPLGSFAFSSGLESYLAHHKALPKSTSTSTSPSRIPAFHHFLHLSISSLAGTTIPYILASYRHPSDLPTLDNDLDASTPCTVARRASIAQGRALLSVWERSLRSKPSQNPPPSLPPAAAASPTSTTNSTTTTNASSSPDPAAAASTALTLFSTSLKLPPPHSPNPNPHTPPPNGHFGPLWSLTCLSMSLPLPQTAYVFLLNHAKAVLSAAVRAGVMGPYQAQGVLAGAWLRGEIEGALERNWDTAVEDAGQGVPVMDLWVGRHELLYSRIFNS